MTHGRRVGTLVMSADPLTRYLQRQGRLPVLHFCGAPWPPEDKRAARKARHRFYRAARLAAKRAPPPEPST